MTQRTRIVWFVTIAAALLLVPSRAAAQSGNFHVGHATRLLNVPGTRGETRSVNVHLWYPSLSSEDCNSGQADASGSSDADSGNADVNGDDKGCPSVYTSRLHGIPLLPQWDALSWQIASTTSFENLPISGGRSFPVIIFSHGDRNNAIDYVYTLEALASRGFIVAAPDHVNNTQDDVRIDFVNGQANSTVIPCFDGLSTPCEVLDRVEAEHHSVSDPVASCVQNNLITKTTASVLESMNDRVRDVSAIIAALPAWFRSRADTSRVGLMGHSRGTVTALTAAGGSACWGISPVTWYTAQGTLVGVKAIMGLAIGAQGITLGVDLPNVKMPTLLLAGSLDPNRFVSQTALTYLSPKAVCEITFYTDLLDQCVLIPNAEHPHFDSGYCAQTQSAGAIAQSDRDSAILDLQTVKNLLALPSGTSAKELCGIETFTNPTDITDLVFSLIGFNVTSNPVNVPTTGLTSDEVKDQVVGLAVAFFGSHL